MNSKQTVFIFMCATVVVIAAFLFGVKVGRATAMESVGHLNRQEFPASPDVTPQTLTDPEAGVVPSAVETQRRLS